MTNIKIIKILNIKIKNKNNYFNKIKKNNKICQNL